MKNLKSNYFKNLPLVYIIIVNFRNWKDTIECLDSVIKSTYKNYRVVIVDNGSKNNSVEYIKNWADNKLGSINIIGSEDVCKIDNQTNNLNILSLITLICSDDNKGFSYGNNIGIKYVQSLMDNFEYVWLLNNDTVIEPESLSKLIEKALKYQENNEKVGIIGSKLLYYGNRAIIQGVGGIYNKWLGTSKHLGKFQKDNRQFDNDDITKKIDYVIGASMFVNKVFIEEVGLMNEEYFLGFEELDWTERGKRKGWVNGYCWESIVYHKVGVSMKLDGNKQDISDLSYYYGLRNRILFTRNFYPYFLLTVYAGFIKDILGKIKKRKFNKLKVIFSVIFNIGNN